MPKQPIAELFGFPIDNQSPEAARSRLHRLCPFNNKVPNCTKDSVTNPLGVCTIFHGNKLAVTCPVRLRQDWLIAVQSADFFFPAHTRWTTLVEVRLKDKHGKSAGNIDVILVAYDEDGTILDFGSLEVQTVYISGNIRKAWFQPYMDDPDGYLATDWSTSRKAVPSPDYLSSSRKRLAPQLIYKGGILNAWGKKQAVAVHTAFFDTLPTLPEVPAEKADMAWLIYDLIFDEAQNRYNQILARIVYTDFKSSLAKITVAEAGSMGTFLESLQAKLTARLAGADPAALADTPADEPVEQVLEDLLENL